MDSVGFEEVFVAWVSVVNRARGGVQEAVQGLAGQARWVCWGLCACSSLPHTTACS